ncbi:hypothetical protein Q31a_63180 [Aureliella helgolandensis]|uniref:Uncharacterized protein n=1 Tax=Aureliella helgolandensis TaxID=2527968 RepID=A0A518GH53_9BACT|nr:hypothetical protein Q31a_63180 [Aureliella helgolandensis]
MNISQPSEEIDRDLHINLRVVLYIQTFLPANVLTRQRTKYLLRLPIRPKLLSDGTPKYSHSPCKHNTKPALPTRGMRSLNTTLQPRPHALQPGRCDEEPCINFAVVHHLLLRLPTGVSHACH